MYEMSWGELHHPIPGWAVTIRTRLEPDVLRDATWDESKQRYCADGAVIRPHDVVYWEYVRGRTPVHEIP